MKMFVFVTKMLGGCGIVSQLLMIQMVFMIYAAIPSTNNPNFADNKLNLSFLIQSTLNSSFPQYIVPNF